MSILRSLIREEANKTPQVVARFDKLFAFVDRTFKLISFIVALFVSLAASAADKRFWPLTILIAVLCVVATFAYVGPIIPDKPKISIYEGIGIVVVVGVICTIFILAGFGTWQAVSAYKPK